MSAMLLEILTSSGMIIFLAAVIVIGAIFLLRILVKSSVEEGVKFGFAKALRNTRPTLSGKLRA